MWLQATLTAKDLHDALDKITPLRIPLDNDDPDRCLWLGKPTEVRLSPGGFTGGFGLALPPEIALLRAKGVAEDVKLTAAQAKKLDGIARTYQEASDSARRERAIGLCY